MKKVVIIGVIALVVLGCVFVAGCTSQDTTKQPDQSKNTIQKDKITPAVTVTVPTVEGTFYNVGNIAQIVLPESAISGQWNITSKDDNLEIRDMGYQAVKSTTTTTSDGKSTTVIGGDGGNHTYWITSEKAGTYKFTLKYTKSSEGKSTEVAVYNGTITFKDESDKAIFPDGPSTSFVFDTANINPKVGEYVKIVIPKGNATTGYTWKATGSGLTIADDYIVDEHPEGMVGVGGTTVFYVKADKAGTYTLKAEYGRSWENSPIEAFEINLTFI